MVCCDIRYGVRKFRQTSCCPPSSGYTQLVHSELMFYRSETPKVDKTGGVVQAGHYKFKLIG